MLSKKMEKALNDQLSAEYYSAYLYLAMSAFCESLDLTGFANWMRVQFDEEMVHAMKFLDFIHSMDGRVTLQAIPAPPKKWDSPTAVFEDSYHHEQQITGRINTLVDQAIKEKDHATNNFLQWFVREQVEEEASAAAILKKLKFVGDSKTGLLMIDQELSQRQTDSAETTA